MLQNAKISNLYQVYINKTEATESRYQLYINKTEATENSLPPFLFYSSQLTQADQETS